MNNNDGDDELVMVFKSTQLLSAGAADALTEELLLNGQTLEGTAVSAADSFSVEF